MMGVMCETNVTPPSCDVDPRIARSRAKLLTAATDILVESGARAVTVDAVAERSGVAKSTLYRHWASRPELLADVLRTNAPAISVPDLTQGFEFALRRLVDEIVSTTTDREWARILPALFALKQQLPEVAEVADADRDQKMTAIAAVIGLGVAEGVLPEGLDPYLVALQLLGPFLMAALLANDYDSATLADEVIRRFLPG
jgi:AcrR family transcriptional regulator